MDKVKSFMEKSYKIIAYVAICSILILVNFYHLFAEVGLSSIQNILAIITELIVLILFNKFIIEKMKSKSIIIFTIFFMIVFFMLEILSVFFFRVKYNWDFKWLMDSAKDIATRGTTENIFYFKIFPNNLGALIIVTLAMKIFFGNEIGAYIVNIIFIFIAVLFSVLSTKKMWGEKCALNTMILLLFSAPLYLYSPIIYTDTLSVPFPVMTIYFWIIAKEQKEISNKKHFLALVFMTISAGIGYCIKPVAAIVLVAIIIDKIFTNKEVIKSTLMVILLFLIIITGFNKLTAKYILKDNRKNECEYPVTHWIMMGLGKPESEGGTSIGYGAYNQKDSDYTATSGNYDEKKQANIKIIKERLKDFGIKGYIEFLYKKCRYVWNDGTYYVLNKIGWDTINTASTPYKIVLGDKSNVFKKMMAFFNNTLFVAIISTFIVEIRRKDTKQETRILGISIVGIAIFLLIWEARSRYIYFMIPIFCILGTRGISNILDILKSDKIKQISSGRKNLDK